MQLDPKSLPDLASIRRRTQALAMLDAIVCPEWESRYYSFNASWGEGEEMASMRNGSGDDWFLLFDSVGAAIKGLAHETSIARENTFRSDIEAQLPKAFSSFLAEPAFNMSWASYCYWRESGDSSWHKVVHPDPLLSKSDDGSAEYLHLLFEPASSYEGFAKWYYEVDLPLASIEAIYMHRALTETLVKSLNPELTLAEAHGFAAEIGYPIANAEADL